MTAHEMLVAGHLRKVQQAPTESGREAALDPIVKIGDAPPPPSADQDEQEEQEDDEGKGKPEHAVISTFDLFSIGGV